MLASKIYSSPDSECTLLKRVNFTKISEVVDECDLHFKPFGLSLLRPGTMWFLVAWVPLFATAIYAFTHSDSKSTDSIARTPLRLEERPSKDPATETNAVPKLTTDDEFDDEEFYM